MKILKTDEKCKKCKHAFYDEKYKYYFCPLLICDKKKEPSKDPDNDDSKKIITEELENEK